MKTLLPLIAVFGISPLVSQADEPLPRGHYKITRVEVQPIDRVKDNGSISDQASDRLTHWIRFDVRTWFKIEANSGRLPFKIVNPAVDAQSSLTLDKPIEFNGEKVPAGTNLLKYRKFDGSFFNVSMPVPNPLAIGSARIQSGFKLPADTYTFKFSWTTATGETFENVVKAYVDVELPPSK